LVIGKYLSNNSTTLLEAHPKYTLIYT